MPARDPMTVSSPHGEIARLRDLMRELSPGWDTPATSDPARDEGAPLRSTLSDTATAVQVALLAGRLLRAFVRRPAQGKGGATRNRPARRRVGLLRRLTRHLLLVATVVLGIGIIARRFARP